MTTIKRHNYTLMLGDCLERMKEIEDASVDLVVTSPPYDESRAYAKFSEFDELFSELYRIMKHTGIVVFNIQDKVNKKRRSLTSFRTVFSATGAGFILHDTLIYSRQGVCGEYKGRFRTDHEYLFVYRKTDAPHTCNKKQIQIPAKHPNKKYKGTTQRERDGNTRVLERGRDGVVVGHLKDRGTIWEYGVPNAERGLSKEEKKLKFQHPATFPDELATDLIICWSNPGDIVLDPFLGSGTTVVSAIKTGRVGLGIEKQPEYLDIALRRIKMTDQDSAKRS